MNEIEMKARITELEAKLAAVQHGVQPVQAVPVAKNGRKVLVDAGSLQMVLNALERDARAGQQVRAEMRFDLMQSITHPTQQGLDAEAIRVAVLSCGHSIERDYVKLRYEPEQEGHNALNQLSRRIAAAIAAQAKQGEQ